ncbi:MAG: hypothetical protein ACMG6S_06470, partial [Byssovorax sp.]
MPKQSNNLQGAAGQMEQRERVLLWAAMIVGIGLSGIAFIYKIAEFIFTLGGDEVPGFADVPVAVYFVVAAGWLCLLVWCYVTRQFVD